MKCKRDAAKKSNTFCIEIIRIYFIIIGVCLYKHSFSHNMEKLLACATSRMEDLKPTEVQYQ